MDSFELFCRYIVHISVDHQCSVSVSVGGGPLRKQPLINRRRRRRRGRRRSALRIIASVSPKKGGDPVASVVVDTRDRFCRIWKCSVLCGLSLSDLVTVTFVKKRIKLSRLPSSS